MDSRHVQASLPDRMLQLLGEGGLHSTAELARRLQIGEGMVAALLQDLARHGYLTAVENGCGTSCSGCWAAGSCAGPESASPMLALTPRGRLAAQRRR